jgi:energy-coupling factor transport system permease protein
MKTDPRTQLFILLIVSCVTSIAGAMTQNYILTALCCLYLLIQGLRKRTLYMAAAYLVILFLLLFTQRWFQAVSIIFYTFLLMMPPIVTAGALLSNSPSRLICAFSRLHCPKSALLVACVLIRFFPMFAAESRSIRNGMRARGVLGRIRDIIRHPAFAYECFLVPLMVRSLKLSSELSAAAFLRGAECNGSRSTTHAIGFGRSDAAILVYVMAACSGVLLLGGLPI